MSQIYRRGWLLGLACAIAGSVTMTGCDSSTGAIDNGTTGKLSVHVTWPAEGDRLIPAGTSSILIAVTGNTAGLSAPANQVLGRGVSEALFPGLKPGSYTVAVAAHPNNDGTGQALAFGSKPDVTVVRAQTTVVNITLASTVRSVTAALAPSTTDDVAAHTVSAVLTGWTLADGRGDMVPIDAGHVTWVSGTPSVATVSAATGNGVTVTPVTGAAGATTRLVVITGRYRELPIDLSASVTLTVNPASTTGAIDVNVN